MPNGHEEPDGRLGRWVIRLSEFDFELSYRKGRKNYVHSRLFIEKVAKRL